MPGAYHAEATSWRWRQNGRGKGWKRYQDGKKNVSEGASLKLKLRVNEIDEIFWMVNGHPISSWGRVRRRLSFFAFTIPSCSQLLLDRPF